MTASTGPPRGWIVAGAVGAVLVLVVLVLVFAGGDGDEVVIAPTPTPTPTPVQTSTPEPVPEPVRGEVVSAGLTSLATDGTGLYQQAQAENQPVPPDEAQVNAFISSIQAWLDEALTRVSMEGEVTLGGDLRGSPELLRLAGPDNFIVEARYHMTVGARGEPEWAHVLVEVTLVDGSERSVDLAVLPGDPPVLVSASATTSEPPEDEAEADE